MWPPLPNPLLLWGGEGEYQLRPRGGIQHLERRVRQGRRMEFFVLPAQPYFAVISLLYRRYFPDKLRDMVVFKTSKLFGGMLASEMEALEHTAQVRAYK